MLVGQLTHEKILICLIFPHFQDRVNSTLTSSTWVYTMSILLFLFFPHFHSTLQCPYSCWTPVIPAESSRIQWSPVEWNWIPVNSTGLQTEMEIELEFCSKHMCTNSCKHKYSIYTDFCMCQWSHVQWEHFGVQFKLIWETTIKGYNFCLSIFRNRTCHQPPNNPWHGPWHTESSWYCIS